MRENRISRDSYLEPEEVRALINSVRLVSKQVARDTLVAETMWQTGCRLIEALTLVPEHIGFDSLILQNKKQIKRVKKAGGKTGYEADPAAIKEVQVSTRLCEQLKDFCKDNDRKEGEWVFFGNWNKSKHLCPRYVHRMMGAASAEAGIFRFGKRNVRTGGRYKGAWPHIIRHSTAMYLLAMTGDYRLIQRQLGHSNIQSTMIYMETTKRAARKKISEIDWEVKE